MEGWRESKEIEDKNKRKMERSFFFFFLNPIKENTPEWQKNI